MRNHFVTILFAIVLVHLVPASPACAEDRPWASGRFAGRIAYSADGNHNDPDDWIASPMALAILAEAGLADRLVHFDYNSILTATDPAWEATNAEGILGAAERYGYDKSLFVDCRSDRDAAIAAIANAVNDSAADDPLYLIIAGPMEVPYLGIQKSDPAKRRFVYTISHSRWNDGFAAAYKFTVTKRSVIDEEILWVQIRDQNALLSFGRYGTPSPPDEFQPYFWMRDSRDDNVLYLWKRMLASTRPDPSDAGMAYFLATGDDQCNPKKLRRLLEDHESPRPVAARGVVRLEAENFRRLKGFEVEDASDRSASHRLYVKSSSATETGRIETSFDEPYTADEGRYDVEVRFSASKSGGGRYQLSVQGAAIGPAWEESGAVDEWQSQTIPGVAIRRGDTIAVTVQGTRGGGGRLDYVELRLN
jgi:hypothetical protein